MKKLLALFVTLTALLAGGCATPSNPNIDPFEGFNRAMFGINKGVDQAVVKPVASGYAAIVPAPIRNCIGGVFGHIDDAFVLVNDILQAKPMAALDATGRLVVNTFPGMFGCFDIATPAGLEKQNEDFGQTLGRWGVGNGFYVVLPLFGPSTARDAAGLFLYSRLDPLRQVRPNFDRYALYSLRALDQRSRVLNASNVLEQASPDEYAFVRNAYLQRRRYLIHDGNPPPGGDFDSSSGRVPLAFSAAIPNPADGAHTPRTPGEQAWFDAPNQRAPFAKGKAPPVPQLAVTGAIAAADGQAQPGEVVSKSLSSAAARQPE